MVVFFDVYCPLGFELLEVYSSVLHIIFFSGLIGILLSHSFVFNFPVTQEMAAVVWAYALQRQAVVQVKIKGAQQQQKNSLCLAVVFGLGYDELLITGLQGITTEEKSP